MGNARDDLAEDAVRAGDDPRLEAIVAEACRVTGMGFAAIARVTEDRWIACQVLDKIEFGLKPGDELKIATTICDDIRKSGAAIIIDHVAEDDGWRTHHTPMLYGFESYASLPIVLADGSFYGTLCAIDPAPRALKAGDTVQRLRALAAEAAKLLSERIFGERPRSDE